MKMTFGRYDVGLGLLGLLGLLGFVLLLPARHPDAAATFEPGAEAMMEKARAVLADNGVAADGIDVQAYLRRDRDLLRALQDSLGRPETVALLQANAARHLPAYFWHVRFARPLDPDQGDGNFVIGDETVMSVDLGQDGSVWGMRVDRDRLPRAFVRRKALAAVWRPGTREEAPLPDWAAIPDTVLAGTLRFDFEPVAGPPDGTPPEERVVYETLHAGGRVALDARAALALARYHLKRTLPEDLDLQLDSAWVLPGESGREAALRFSTTRHRQHLRAEVQVAATGALRRLSVDFNRDVDSGTDVLAVVAGSLKAGLYALMILVLMVTFFRRMMARLIDVRAALLDALVFGVAFGLFIALSRDFLFDDAGIALWLRLLIGTFVVLLGIGISAVFFFMISSATDSLARSVWPKKVLTVSLLRQGAVRNAHVGAALLRGVALAGVLLGVLALMLTLLPGVRVDLFDRLLREVALQPLLWTGLFEATLTYLLVLVVLLGVGSFVCRWQPRAGVVVGVVALAMALLQATPADLGAGWGGWGVAAAYGLVAAAAFWRYDLLTAFVGLLLAELVWDFSDGWLMTASPAGLDVLLLAAGIGGLLVLGLVGVRSGRSGRDVPEYVPAYIEEMAAQERMKRELEIAHEVQGYFLPREMPRVAGLDVAGLCLPALDVGGDYYDFVELGPGRLAVVVGDVSGKGIEAAFYMTLTKGFLRTLCREVDDPAEVLRRLNRLFCESVPRGVFISMIYGVVDVEARTFTFARAGHNPVLLKRSPSQEADCIQPAGLGIGLVTGPRFDRAIEECRLRLRPGDVLVFYTDGFSEAMNGARAQYGDDRLARRVGRVGRRSAAEILDWIVEDVHGFVDGAGRHDDMTMVVLRLDGERPPDPA